jgi:hypothetical protein
MQNVLQECHAGCIVWLFSVNVLFVMWWSRMMIIYFFCFNCVAMQKYCSRQLYTIFLAVTIFNKTHTFFVSIIVHGMRKLWFTLWNYYTRIIRENAFHEFYFLLFVASQLITTTHKELSIQHTRAAPTFYKKRILAFRLCNKTEW